MLLNLKSLSAMYLENPESIDSLFLENIVMYQRLK